MLVSMIGEGRMPEEWRRWIAFGLSLPVMLYVGGPFYRSAWRGLLHRSAGMDLLVVLGASSAFLYSVAATIRPDLGPVYYDGAAMILTLITLGRFLEIGARRRAADELEGIVSLLPREAILLRGEQPVRVPVDAVLPDDRLLVPPGERIPADGRIERGRTEIDESLMTGESIPAAKAPGDPVIGGTVNGGGSIVVRVTGVGEQTLLARIAETVRRAQETKPPLQRVVDRVAAVFVPVIILIAAATFLGWMTAGAGLAVALVRSVSVLVVACPCALGLATPAAISVATGVAARHGIVVRDAPALEAVARIDRMVFDKTGTITRGKPKVVQVGTVGEGDAADWILLAGEAEAHSSHPLAAAIVEEVERRGIRLSPLQEGVREFPGCGVEAEIRGRRVRVGEWEWVSAPAGAPAECSDEVRRMEAEGRSVVGVAVDGRLRGWFGLMDEPRPEAADVVSRLRRLGVELSLLSGDSAPTVRAVAERVGIHDWAGRVAPWDKADRIGALQEKGHRVGMVGDGINDAAALARADVGIAMARGAAGAVDQAALTLAGDALTPLPEAVIIARACLRTIRQNLAWAFGYNAILVPVAAAGYLNPMLAAAVMASSSLVVVGNALRLRSAGERRGGADPAVGV